MEEPIAIPYAVHEERFHGVLRDRLGCLTRKTHAFAKDARTWDALVVVGLFEANWLRPHPALREPTENLPNGRRYRRRTPAMAMGLTDHIWKGLKYPRQDLNLRPQRPQRCALSPELRGPVWSDDAAWRRRGGRDSNPG